MDTSNPTFQEFRAYWRLSEEMIAEASKDDLAEAARILAMQAAHYARKYGRQTSLIALQICCPLRWASHDQPTAPY